MDRLLLPLITSAFLAACATTAAVPPASSAGGDDAEALAKPGGDLTGCHKLCPVGVDDKAQACRDWCQCLHTTDNPKEKCDAEYKETTGDDPPAKTAEPPLAGNGEVLPGLPDLVASLEVTGEATKGPPTEHSPQGVIDVPVRVVIENRGHEGARDSRVTVDFSDGDGEFQVPFVVPGQPTLWSPQIGPLLIKASAELVGKLSFRLKHQGATVTVIATADSCAGEEHAPEFCLVKENDETNNRSAPVSLKLPMFARGGGSVLPPPP